MRTILFAAALVCALAASPPVTDDLINNSELIGRQLTQDEPTGATTGKKPGRAPSCGGCARREAVLSQTMRLQSYGRVVNALGATNAALLAGLISLAIFLAMQHFLSRDTLVTLGYVILYLIASPTAILVNKILMKDYGFGYPVLVSALGQSMTIIGAYVAVHCFGVSTEMGKRVDRWSMVLLGGTSALALVLGQYPYLYLTVAFIQMLKAFSPAYMVCFLYCLGVEYPSRKVIACVLGLSLCTAVASAGEVHFNLIGVLFMAAASCSDALRLVVAQRLLRNMKMHPIETLYFISPICVLWMVPAALLTELPTALKSGSVNIFLQHPFIFLASGISGAFVNLTSFLLVKRTSSMTLKTLTMARNGGLVIVSAVIMGETITGLEAFGYTGLLLCFTMYTIVKASEGSLTSNTAKQTETPASANEARPLCVDRDSRDEAPPGMSPPPNGSKEVEMGRIR